MFEDLANEVRYGEMDDLLGGMSPEEIQPAFSPQIICISDPNLTDA